MKSYINLATDLTEGILTVTINRENKLNALNRETMFELKEIFQYVQDNSKEIQGVILTGAGEKAFVAGADISAFTAINEMRARRLAEEGQEIFQSIENSHTPVVAIINGFALGGGCELAMAAHIRIAVEGAKFGQPEVNLGLIPGYGGTQRLTQLIGKGKAFEYLMSADMISAGQALDWGLVNYVEADKQTAHTKAVEILSKIMKKAPIAIGLVIDAVNAHFKNGINGYQTEADGFAACFNTQDFKEGVSAFLEKRPANFKGK
ncbi:MAG: enoyl-CoA hydratase/isomerase family protein [Ekhidna sp.]|nr:enoyl-CoA hydratase/isomerase family protein [Ekhidna sp.]MBC6409327.1 enoyl-CoA hydratase/isomerase family protein [Ekhidna sp.]MBC6425541.1 enoyl-CoA hydratase/isomerase family protein [Ekhidna sp.]